MSLVNIRDSPQLLTPPMVVSLRLQRIDGVLDRTDKRIFWEIRPSYPSTVKPLMPTLKQSNTSPPPLPAIAALAVRRAVLDVGAGVAVIRNHHRCRAAVCQTPPITPELSLIPLDCFHPRTVTVLISARFRLCELFSSFSHIAEACASCTGVFMSLYQPTLPQAPSCIGEHGQGSCRKCYSFCHEMRHSHDQQDRSARVAT